ncbi:hypothetical protein WMY93_019216 [Mugilogobius chulae]|uniref:Zinc transporter ZIP4 n=1 Tax=Mugilogobius chulae TaxID=88201 RepID=A0AAW0NEQ0_9GOBI
MYSSLVRVFFLFVGCAFASASLEEVYLDVVRTVTPGAQELTRTAARTVFNTLENRVQCGKVPCGKCRPADAIHQLITTNQENNNNSLYISVSDFSFLAAGGVLYLRSPELACAAINRGAWKEETERFLHELAHGGHQHDKAHQHDSVNVKTVELLLQSLQYRPLEAQSCVGAGDLTDGLEDGDLGTVLGRVLFHTLKGNCFMTLALPDQSFFLNDILHRLGSDNFTVEELKRLMSSLNLGSEDDHDHDHDHSEEHEGHNHLRVKRSAQEANSTWGGHCFSAEDLIQIYSLTNSSSSEATSDLARISPALIQQVLSGACSETPLPVKPDGLSKTDRYLYATLANVVITLLAMFGIVVLLCTSCTTMFQLSIQFCVSLAVGSLTGDALLHLMPMFLGLHVHTEEGSSGHDHSHNAPPPDYVLKMLVVMAGIYYFYLMETLFSLISHRKKKHQQSHHHGDESEPHHCDHGRVLEMYQQEKQKEKSVSRADLVDSEEEKPQKKRTREQRLLPYMITIGDSIHNFADGLALGAAFSVSWKSGLATSIAVMCHELPHELGDFAILLNCGVSIRRALLLNVGSALTSFFGLYIALSVATDVATQQWIAAVTSGLFLYVGLADMLPTLVHIDSRRPWTMFLLQNVGLLSGWSILLLLSLYEEEISF